MKVESLIKREGGTEITIGKTKYHFEPDDDGNHVCNVANKAHIDILLAIKEGYREAPAPKAAPK